MSSVAAISGVGAGGFFFDLTSECKCGVRMHIKGYTSTVAAGVGLTTSAGALRRVRHQLRAPNAKLESSSALLAGVESAPAPKARVDLSALVNVDGVVSMSLFARLRSGAFLTVAIAMAAGMLGSIAGVDVIAILTNPGFAISPFVAGLGVAPWAERVLPFKRRRD